MDLFLVVYFMGSTKPVGLLATDLDRPACERRAAEETAKSIAAGEPFRVNCERRGPSDMIWKLHPELR